MFTTHPRLLTVTSIRCCALDQTNLVNRGKSGRTSTGQLSLNWFQKHEHPNDKWEKGKPIMAVPPSRNWKINRPILFNISDFSKFDTCPDNLQKWMTPITRTESSSDDVICAVGQGFDTAKIIILPLQPISIIL